MKIILDVMGGDNPPEELVRGAVLALRELPNAPELILVGDEGRIRKALRDQGASAYEGKRVTVVHAEQVITMEDDPFDVVRKKKNSSMAQALRMLADGVGDAVVCTGNTGALFTGASMIVRTVKGIRRAAIASMIPFDRPLLLLDSGANVTVTTEYMEQFAFMGSVYMEKVMHIREPEVGLANNGTEAHKGTPLQVETYQRLSAMEDIRFVGNIEGKDIPKGKCDVLVADGFTGNIILKLTEGMCSFLFKRLKQMFLSNAATKLSALVLKGELTKIKTQYDASTYGGAPFLGISKPVIKAHGSSDAVAVKNAIRQAAAYAETGVTDEIARRAERYLHKKPKDDADTAEQ